MARIDYLPLGSVVMLKKGLQKLIIIGRALNVNRDGKDYFFDYAAVLHPQGLINTEVAYFNHDDVEKIFFTGYNDEGSREMTDIINDFVEKNPEINRGNVEEWNEVASN
jgi:hypothetical protein